MNRYEKKALRTNVAYLVKRLANDENITTDVALERIMKTDLYAALMDSEMELYGESGNYLYKVLRQELHGDKNAVIKMYYEI